MENLGKKVGYLKGLMEGLDFSDDPSKGKLLAAMAELMGDLVDRVESLDELMDDLNDYVESIDDDLAALEGDSDDYHAIDDDDDEYDDDFPESFPGDIPDECYDDPSQNIEDQLHLLNGKMFSSRKDGTKLFDEKLFGKAPSLPPVLTGSICAACGRMFLVDQNDPEDAQYDCPHCGKRVSASPLTQENTPIVHPGEE